MAKKGKKWDETQFKRKVALNSLLYDWKKNFSDGQISFFSRKLNQLNISVNINIQLLENKQNILDRYCAADERYVQYSLCCEVHKQKYSRQLVSYQTQTDVKIKWLANCFFICLFCFTLFELWALYLGYLCYSLQKKKLCVGLVKSFFCIIL